MKIAVLLPVYNGAATVANAIESVLNQHTNETLDLYVIDNASTDNTADVARGAIKRSYPSNRFLRVSRCDLPGISSAMNSGLFQILSDPFDYDMVARIDADDMWFLDKISHQVHFMSENPDVAICGTNMVSQHRFFSYPEKHNEIVNFLFNGLNPIAHPSVLVKTEVFKKIGVYDSRMNGAEDMDLWCRSVSAGFKFANIQKNLVRYNFDPSKDTSIGDKLAAMRGRILDNVGF